MLKYILRRLMLFFPTLFIVTVILFILLRVAPGDEATNIILGTGAGIATEEQVQALRVFYGFDEPLWKQYGIWIGNFFQGDLGTSIASNIAVNQLIWDRFPTTLRLGLMGMVIALVFSIPIGVLSAMYPDKWPDYLGRGLAIGALSIPGFWIAIMIIVFPAIWWGWTPPLIYVPFGVDAWSNIKIFFIPAILVAIPLMGTVIRMTRSMMMEVLRSDYIRTAQAKGLRHITVVRRHALKNAMIPIVTIVGTQVGVVLGGTVIVESVFQLPGVGVMVRDGVLQDDFPVVQSVTFLLAFVTLSINLIVDIAYTWLDPRIRYA